ncbi:MAG: DUF4012 domain-containing protein, partial [Atopobiaceae bacterium]|nr:DUF4012 domain-containing protein [Atopobiaceae bacterium]
MANTSRGGRHFANDGAAPSAGRSASPYATSRETSSSAYASELDRVKSRGHGGSEVRFKEPKRRHHVWPVVLVVILVLLGVVGFSGLQLYESVKVVKADATVAIQDVSTMKDKVLAGNTDEAQTAADDIVAKSAEMKKETSGVLWALAEHVPVYGSDVKAARELVDVLDDVAQNAVAPVSDQLPSLNVKNIVGDDGSIDVASLQDVATVLGEVEPVISRNAATVDALPETHVDQLTKAVDKVKELFPKAESLLSSANQVAPYLPQMLGGNGQTRTYLIVAQNNAEIRATGGFPGSWGTLSVTDGKMTLGDFASIQTTSVTADQQPSITDEEEALFGTGLKQSPGNSNYTPDFTRAAQLMSEYWQIRGGSSVDGVVAIDPVFLQNVLKLVGGFTAADGSTVDGTNAARVLLSDTYWNLPVDEQDAFFASVAGQSFKQFFSNIGKVSIKSLATTLKSSISDHRIQVWMADDTEEAALEGLGITGSISTDVTKPVLGVYLDDETWSKICWYLSTTTQVGAATANADGTRSYQVTTTLANSFTTNIASTAPAYVYGYNTLKRDRTDMITHVYLYAPAGGSISNVSASGGWTFTEGS